MLDQKLNKIETNQGSTGATNQPNSALKMKQYPLTKQRAVQFN